MFFVQFVELGLLLTLASLVLIVGEIALQPHVRRRLRRVDAVVGHDGKHLGPESDLPPESCALIRAGVGRGRRRARGGRAGEAEGASADDGAGRGQYGNLYYL